jgi:hypothetical protein
MATGPAALLPRLPAVAVWGCVLAVLDCGSGHMRRRLGPGLARSSRPPRQGHRASSLRWCGGGSSRPATLLSRWPQLKKWGYWWRGSKWRSCTRPPMRQRSPRSSACKSCWPRSLSACLGFKGLGFVWPQGRAPKGGGAWPGGGLRVGAVWGDSPPPKARAHPLPAQGAWGHPLGHAPQGRGCGLLGSWAPKGGLAPEPGPGVGSTPPFSTMGSPMVPLPGPGEHGKAANHAQPSGDPRGDPDR